VVWGLVRKPEQVFRRNIRHLSFQKDQTKLDVVKQKKKRKNVKKRANKRCIFKRRSGVQTGKTEELKLRCIR